MIELAALDALDLLDPEDKERYERAFRDASPELQQEVRATQARVSVMDGVLPDVEPDASLRSRVIEAVARAREGQAISGVGRTVVHHPGRSMPKVAQSRRVSPLWRAASIGLCVAVMVLGVVAVQIQEHNTRLGEAVFVSEYFQRIGPRHLRDTLFDANTKRAIFARTEQGAQLRDVRAVVLSNPDWKTARLFCEGLSGQAGTKAVFHLCVVDAKNRVVENLKSFESDGRWETFDVAVKLEPGVRLAIFADLGSQGRGDMILLAEGLA